MNNELEEMYAQIKTLNLQCKCMGMSNNVIRLAYLAHSWVDEDKLEPIFEKYGSRLNVVWYYNYELDKLKEVGLDVADELSTLIREDGCEIVDIFLR